MTSNQLQYWRNVETNRNNVAVETETHRSNLAREVETNRSNLARESETNRHNVATEHETNRHNVQTEKLGWEQLRTNQYQFAKTFVQNKINAQRDYNIRAGQLNETIRMNKARETENTRHNMASEQLSKYDQEIRERQNKRSYAISQAQLRQEQSKIEETKRSNMAREVNNLLAVKETQRSNVARETENTRSNVARENISMYSNATQRQRLDEDKRHNRTTEQLTRTGQLQKLTTDLAHIFVNGVTAINKSLQLGGI